MGKLQFHQARGLAGWKKREESTEVPFHEKNHEFCKVKLMQFKRTSENCSSEEEHKVNALASGAEEGRD